MPLLHIHLTRSSINAINGTITTVVPHFFINASNINNTLLPTLVDKTTINVSFLHIAITYAIAAPCSRICHIAVCLSNRFNPLEMFLVVAMVDDAHFTYFTIGNDELVRSTFISFLVIDRTLLRLNIVTSSFSLFHSCCPFFSFFDLVLSFFYSR